MIGIVVGIFIWLLVLTILVVNLKVNSLKPSSKELNKPKQAIKQEKEYEELGFREPEETIEVAKSKGLVVRTPNLNELFIDIDSEESYNNFQKCYQLLFNNKILFNEGIITSKIETPSASGLPFHYHIVVSLNRPIKDEYERIMLQSLLGSDPKREMITYLRTLSGSTTEAANVFFEKG